MCEGNRKWLPFFVFRGNMSYETKAELVRNNIINAAKTYKEILVGRYYLYVFENQCFEMYYGTDNFLHLTGAGTNLSANQFYELAVSGKLQTKQLFFNQRFPLHTALKKTEYLSELEKFIKEGYFVVKDLKTATVLYPYTITNIDQSVLLGLKEETNKEIHIPKSFRVKGNIFEKAENKNLYEINFICSKTDYQGLYDTVLYKEKDWETLPREILDKIDLS